MRTLAALLAASLLLPAHEGGKRDTRPTKAAKDLRLAKAKLDESKKELQKGAKYSCCVKASCGLCQRKAGACQCAEAVTQKKKSCGECLAGWRSGRGAVRRVSGETIELDPANAQNTGELSPALKEGMEALLRAKKVLAEERRLQCCVRGGCGECAFEGGCACGGDLAQGKGVCGDCYHGWHTGQGLFAGIRAEEVRLAVMDGSMTEGMTASASGLSGAYATGTSQTPAVRPMNMLNKQIGAWNVMFHGTIWGVYTNQGGPRGRDKTFGTGWLMPMANRRFAGGTFTLRTMFSIEPLTVTHGRYPLLLQTGETWKNIPILNGQHPHDFIKELAGAYQYRLSENTTINLYAGLRGDPAIGPTAYPHRISSSENPLAVISHHYQDATHIATSVVTAGVTHRWLTLEASGFHGREPDEKRWGMETGGINSFSARATVTPSDRWAWQYSAGRINNREATHPDRDSFRQTASATYVRPMARGHWASAAIWGRNHDLEYTQQPNGDLLAILQSTSRKAPERQHIVLVPTRVRGQIYNSYTAESTLFFRNRHWLWGRAELTDKDSLLLFEEAPYVRLLEEFRYTRVKAFTAGYSFELPAAGSFLRPAIGGQVQVYRLPSNLAPIYGAHPIGMQVWLRVRFAAAPPGQL